MKTKHKILFCLLLLVPALVFFVQSRSDAKTIQMNGLTIAGQISDEKAAKSAFETLKKNIEAVNDEDIDAYLTTIIPSSREETKKEMSQFFKDYDLKNELLTFEVKKQDDTHMLIQAQQKSQNLGKKDYRSHIAEANHTFVKEGDQWLIQETVITNTQFTK